MAAPLNSAAHGIYAHMSGWLKFFETSNSEVEHNFETIGPKIMHLNVRRIQTMPH